MSGPPLISVVVPTHARPDALRACLESLAAVDYPRARFEVLVVDDGSPVAPEEAVAGVAARIDVTLLTKSRGGPASARNVGAARARGEILAFIDDDCMADPGWPAAIERRLGADPDLLIGGRIDNALPDNPFSSATQMIVTTAYEYHERHPGSVRTFTTSNLALARAHFEALGAFRTDFRRAGEDYDLCERWHAAGLRAAYAPEAVVRHAHPLSLRSFVRQHVGYGRGLMRCRRYAARASGAALAPHRAGFYLALVRAPLAAERGRRGLVGAGLVALSQVATVAGAVREAVHLRGGPVSA